MSLDDFTTESGKKHKGRSDPTKVYCTDSLVEPSRDKAYFVGVLMGDASLYSTTESRKMLKLGVADKEFVTRFGRVFCNLTNLNWHGFEHEETDVSTHEYSGKKGNHSKVYEVTKGIAPIYDYLKQYTSPEPDTILDELDGYHPWLLRGLWDSEGSVDSDNGRISFTNIDGNIKEIYIRLLESVLGEELDTGDIYIKKDSAGRESIVRIPAKYSEQFMRQVNPTIERKRYRLEQRVTSAVYNRGEEQSEN